MTRSQKKSNPTPKSQKTSKKFQFHNLLQELGSNESLEIGSLKLNENVNAFVNNHLLKNIVDNLPIAVFAKDLKGKYFLYNKKALEITVSPGVDVIGKNDDEIFEKETAELYKKYDSKVIKQKKTLSFEEKRIVDGKEIYYLSVKTPVYGKSRKPFALAGAMIDITKRKKAEEALSQSQTKIHALLQSTHDAIISSDSKGKIVGWNKGAQEIFGYKENEIIGKNLTILMPDCFRELHKKAFQKINNNGKPRLLGKTIELTGLKKNGNEFPIELSLSRWKTKDGTFYTGIIRDITEHKSLHSQLEQKQKTAEDLAKRISIQYKIASILTEVRTTDEIAPKILETIGVGLGWKVGEYWKIGNERLNLLSTWGPSINLEKFKKTTKLILFKKGIGLPGTAWEEEKPIWRNNILKDPKFLRKAIARKENLHGAFAFPVKSRGKIYGIINFLTDEIRPIDQDLLGMTEAIGNQLGQFIERKGAEEALRASEERFRVIFDNAAIGIALLDINGKVVTSNPSYQKALGYSQKELEGKVFTEYTYKKDIKSNWKELEKFKSGEKDFVQYEKRYVGKDGKVICANLTATLFRDAKNKPQFIITMIEDITERKQNETLLMELNKKVINILESITDTFFTLNKNWEFTYINKQAEKLFGQKREALIGKNIWETFPKVSFYKEYKYVMDNQKPIYFEDYLKPVNKWFEVRAYPAKDGIVVYLHDETARKAAEEDIKKEKEFTEKLIDSSIDGIFAFDRDCKVTIWNPGMEKISGVKKSRALNKVIFDVFPILKKNGENKHIFDVLKGKAIVAKDKVYQIPKTKKLGYFEAYYSPLFNEVNEVIGGIAIIREITERKELEKRKDEFMAIASHELKTPITTIKAFTQILERNLAKTGDKKAVYFLENINSQTNRLTALINDLLDVTKIEAGKLMLYKKDFDLDKLVRKTVVDFQYLTDKHEIRKEGEIKENVFGDEYRVGQVLANLLTNAIKYSPKASKIIVEIKSQGDFALVSVQDFGIGIPKEKQTRVFERFYRLGEKNENTSGFGLGLYISKEIVERHGGKIWAEGEVGKGSIFYFTLPITKQLAIKI